MTVGASDLDDCASARGNDRDEMVSLGALVGALGIGPGRTRSEQPVEDAGLRPPGCRARQSRNCREECSMQPTGDGALPRSGPATNTSHSRLSHTHPNTVPISAPTRSHDQPPCVSRPCGSHSTDWCRKWLQLQRPTHSRHRGGGSGRMLTRTMPHASIGREDPCGIRSRFPTLGGLLHRHCR